MHKCEQGAPKGWEKKRSTFDVRADENCYFEGEQVLPMCLLNTTDNYAKDGRPGEV